MYVIDVVKTRHWDTPYRATTDFQTVLSETDGYASLGDMHLSDGCTHR